MSVDQADLCPFCNERFRGQPTDFTLMNTTFPRRECGSCGAVWITQDTRRIYLVRSEFDPRYQKQSSGIRSHTRLPR